MTVAVADVEAAAVAAVATGSLWLMLRRVAHHAGLSDGWMLELRCATGTDCSADSVPTAPGPATPPPTTMYNPAPYSQTMPVVQGAGGPILDSRYQAVTPARY